MTDRGTLQRFDLRAPRLLGWNQVGFLTLLILYCLWSIYITFARPLSPEIQEQLEFLATDITGLVTGLTVVVYGAVIVVTMIFQGLNARYYFARTVLMEDYLRETPDWIVELQKKISAA